MSDVGQLADERQVGERAVPAEAPVGRRSIAAFEWLALIAASFQSSSPSSGAS